MVKAMVNHSPKQDELRLLEALLFAAPQPLSERDIEMHIDLSCTLTDLIEDLRAHYLGRGIELRQIGAGWAFRTAPDLGPLLQKYKIVQKKLSKAALETLAIIAYHQPVTRAEIEDVRGVQVSKGTLDVLLETGWIKMRGRRRAPGRPITYGTTDSFLDQFGLPSLDELPGLKELKGSGLLDSALPPDFDVPRPGEIGDLAGLQVDEDPLDPADIALSSEEDPLRFKDDQAFEEDG